MNTKSILLLTKLNEQLNFTDIEIDDPIQRSENAVNIIINAVEKLKIIFEKEKTKSQEQEIDFFKNIPKQQVGYLIHFQERTRLMLITPTLIMILMGFGFLVIYHRHIHEKISSLIFFLRLDIV